MLVTQTEVIMTDLEDFVAMMLKIGANPSGEARDDGGITLDLHDDGNNISGYMGFTATFDFDKDGNLKGVGIYE